MKYIETKVKDISYGGLKREQLTITFISNDTALVSEMEKDITKILESKKNYDEYYVIAYLSRMTISSLPYLLGNWNKDNNKLKVEKFLKDEEVWQIIEASDLIDKIKCLYGYDIEGTTIKINSVINIFSIIMKSEPRRESAMDLFKKIRKDIEVLKLIRNSNFSSIWINYSDFEDDLRIKF